MYERKGGGSTMPEGLIDLLACPYCKEPLAPCDSGLSCIGCGQAFPITEGGQPDLRPTPPSPELDHPILSASPVRRLAARLRKGALWRIRRLLYSLGKSVECPLCGWHGRRFLPAGTPARANRLCPRCGSLERYRALQLYLQLETPILTHAITLLEIAANRSFRASCQRLPNIIYVSADLMTEGATVFADLTQLGLKSRSIDLLVCMHVMEHVPDDRAAFREMARILKPGAIGILCVPLRGERTDERATTTREERARLFGQYDHVRMYGADIVDRLEDAGLAVESIDLRSYFTPDVRRRNALDGDDRYLFRISPATR